MRRIARVAASAVASAAQMRQKHIARPSPLPEYESVATENGVSMNLFTAVNSALDVSLARDSKVVTFGEDVAFGGVFRCSVDLRDKHGAHRVFNSPLTEQGIAGFAIGMATVGWKPVAEIQFADYIFPAFDQIVNEAAKLRYRTGGQFDCGGLVFRSPCSAVGHGGLYHSQSVEGYFAHTPGVKVVMPSTPTEAKGLLLAAIEDPDPVLVFEPKILYRTAIEEVNPDYYTLPLGKARTVRAGKDLTMVTYGAQVNVAQLAADELAKDGIDVEIIDLRTIVPWDREAVYQSVKKTGRVIVTHEAPITCGFGAEVVSSLTADCFLHLEAPPTRVCGLDTPFPLHEKLYLPNERKLVEAARDLVKY
uniref:3-methyl-2-oxobutanoate dehydrogenase (2-methylpropanoyl-transferring) n=1 Tax=Neobodo designis TaxID=312471 RepID=A0A7S1M1F2_NEODS